MEISFNLSLSVCILNRESLFVWHIYYASDLLKLQALSRYCLRTLVHVDYKHEHFPEKHCFAIDSAIDVGR